MSAAGVGKAMMGKMPRLLSMGGHRLEPVVHMGLECTYFVNAFIQLIGRISKPSTQGTRSWAVIKRQKGRCYCYTSIGGRL